jgi:hypothetical protein
MIKVAFTTLLCRSGTKRPVRCKKDHAEGRFSCLMQAHALRGESSIMQ